MGRRSVHLRRFEKAVAGTARLERFWLGLLSTGDDINSDLFVQMSARRNEMVGRYGALRVTGPGARDNAGQLLEVRKKIVLKPFKISRGLVSN